MNLASRHTGSVVSRHRTTGRNPLCQLLLVLTVLLVLPWAGGCRKDAQRDGAERTATGEDLHLAVPAPAGDGRADYQASPGQVRALAARVDARCARQPGVPAGSLVVEQPADGALFPADLAPASFVWRDDEAPAGRRYLLSLELPGCAGRRIHVLTAEQRWLPDQEGWRLLKRCTTGQPARVRLVALDGAGTEPRVAALASFGFATSVDPVGAPILYRDVPLPFLEALRDMSKIRWRLGDVSSSERPRVVLQDLPVCANCHSFSADGSVLGLDVDYANDKGAYAISEVGPEITLNRSKVVSWSELDEQSKEPTFGLLSQLSPDGRHVVSTVRDRSLFIPRSDPYFSQLFFPAKGILAVHDRQTGGFVPLPGAADPDQVQSSPSWSPDGKELVFARAPVQRAVLEQIEDSKAPFMTDVDSDEFLKERYAIRYDLYRIPFADGRGGEPTPIPGASANGRSNYFARFSPDGRWLVFTQADKGMLLQPGSELYIMPAAGGTPRRMRCNLPRMNSWHSWSPNGRWLVFASKGHSPFTQLYLTHIDEHGQDSPPVLLERFGENGRAANIPEFAPGRAGGIRQIREQFLDDYSYYRLGLFSFHHFEKQQARQQFEQALRLNPDNAEARRELGFVYQRLGAPQQALRQFEQAAQLRPDDPMALSNLGFGHVAAGDYGAAESAYRRALALDPNMALLYFNLARIVSADPRRIDESVELYRKGLKLAPDQAEAHAALMEIFLQQKRVDEALAEMEVLSRLQADDPLTHYNLGLLLTRLGRHQRAQASLRRCLELDPGNPAAHFNLGRLLAERPQTLEAGLKHLRQGLKLEPGSVHGRVLLGDLLVKQGRLREAAAHYRQAANSRPQDAALQQAARELERRAAAAAP